MENADFVLLVGTNPRHEAPLLQARLRKGFLHRGTDVAVVGPKVKLTCDYEHIGTTPQALLDLLSPAQRSAPLAKKLAQAKRPLVIVGSDVAHRDDAAAIFAALASLPTWTNLTKDGWNGFSVLQRVRALPDLGRRGATRATGVPNAAPRRSGGGEGCVSVVVSEWANQAGAGPWRWPGAP